MSQYSYHDSIKVKARADYRCELCGSDEMVQAHAPDGDHSDWRNGVCLCAQHHSEQHPELPKGLFFTRTHQPYWPNISARALAVECGRHSRTIIRASRRLGIPSGGVLSETDKLRLMKAVQRPVPPPRKSYECLRCGSSWLSEAPIKPKQCPSCGSRDWSWSLPHTCLRCQHLWVSRTRERPCQCPNCKSPDWDKPYTARTIAMVDRMIRMGAV